MSDTRDALQALRDVVAAANADGTARWRGHHAAMVKAMVAADEALAARPSAKWPSRLDMAWWDEAAEIPAQLTQQAENRPRRDNLTATMALEQMEIARRTISTSRIPDLWRDRAALLNAHLYVGTTMQPTAAQAEMLTRIPIRRTSDLDELRPLPSNPCFDPDPQ
jgi:hypothetical protein